MTLLIKNTALLFGWSIGHQLPAMTLLGGNPAYVGDERWAELLDAPIS